MLNAYTVNTGSIYSEFVCAKSKRVEKLRNIAEIGADFNPWYSSRLFLRASKLCFRD